MKEPCRGRVAGVDGDLEGVSMLSSGLSTPSNRETNASSPAVLGGVLGKVKAGWGYR